MRKKVKSEVVSLRVTPELKERFLEACGMADMKATEVLEKLMREFTEIEEESYYA
ncbi:hypothetical protein H8J87_06410 [Clostridium perfringens]|uniref:Uncharacterized protein n=1 Tax=Clostridium perfringens TaxID=1502 RepID=A0AAW9HRS7_CLOPF|nr:hypothetical protein [Clostridium perfringens]EJT5936373.1 hypothetical protein [Clostridium perfringens]MBI6073690.1 hypothetical protein [Clostridium perfringens]MBI6104501.1 hypothetical protein [Clostridium perfringens]MDM0628341.1 hypothetical protein [Clostridium perfringens]MDU2047782.1 hypothetical protein [Clostridium perfringens]